MIRSADFVESTIFADELLQRKIFFWAGYLLISPLSQNGSVAEWLNAPVLKTGDG